MELRDYYIILYDYYGELLSDKQRMYFEYYYFDNLSLQEISENLGVSRNAIHKALLTIEKKLDFFEEKLHLVDKYKKVMNVLSVVDDNVKNKIVNILN